MDKTDNGSIRYDSRHNVRLPLFNPVMEPYAGNTAQKPLDGEHHGA